MPDVHRVTIVTDATMTRLGFVDRVSRVLQRRHEPVTLQIIDNVEPEPSIDSVQRGAQLMRERAPSACLPRPHRRAWSRWPPRWSGCATPWASSRRSRPWVSTSGPSSTLCPGRP
nr:iron-containing alcohol dehydrogenase [Streptomyces sp. NBRC 110028]